MQTTPIRMQSGSGKIITVASSFTYLPGVPLLHSRDLVHWEIINYCVPALPLRNMTGRLMVREPGRHPSGIIRESFCIYSTAG